MVSSGQYPGSYYYPASTYDYTSSSRESTYNIDMIIVHVTEGPWSSAINWFEDPNAGASAHYVVRHSDGLVGQSVLEKDVAWHCGNWYYNTRSIGIEHEGYSANPSYWFTPLMYQSSARLAAYLCKKYAIPVDRYHIIGHNEVPNPNYPGQYGGVDGHTDPGSGWDWTTYMNYIKSYVGSSSYSQAVDNADNTRFWADGSYWQTGSYNTQKYGADYRYATPNTSSHPAYFKIKTPAAANYAVYGRWPAGSTYNDRALFWVKTASGWVSKTVSQRVQGGQWVYLGTYPIAGGDDWIMCVDTKSSGTGYIIADAVAIVRA